MPATRTQVYFTEEQRKRLDEVARRKRTTLAHVVRDAVDAYLGREAPDYDAVLAATFGSVPDLEVPPRHEWDRDRA